MAPIFTGLARTLGGYGFGRLSGETSGPVPTDIVIANKYTASVSSTPSAATYAITLPPTFTKLVVFGVAGGGGAAHRNDGDNGGGGGGGAAGYIGGYDIPFASITGSTIVVGVARGAQASPSDATGGPYGAYTGVTGGPSYVSDPSGYLWRALGGEGGKVSENNQPAPTRAGGAGGTMSTGTGQSGGAGGTGMQRGGGTSQSQNASPGFTGGGGGGGAWGGPESDVRGTGGTSGAIPSSYVTPDGKTTINFSSAGSALAQSGRPDASNKAGGFSGEGIGFTITSSVPTLLHPAPLSSPGYVHGGGGGGQNGYNVSLNSPWLNYGSGGAGFVLVVAVGVPL